MVDPADPRSKEGDDGEALSSMALFRDGFLSAGITPSLVLFAGAVQVCLFFLFLLLV